MRTEKNCRYISIKQSTVRKTMEEVYQEYCTNGRGDRAYTTIRKQDSLWKNHICSRLENGI